MFTKCMLHEEMLVAITVSSDEIHQSFSYLKMHVVGTVQAKGQTSE